MNKHKQGTRLSSEERKAYAEKIADLMKGVPSIPYRMEDGYVVLPHDEFDDEPTN